MKEIDDFSVCSDNWDQINQVADLQKQVENMRLWFEADKEPDLDLIKQIERVLDGLNDLARQLIDLQIKLLTVL